MMTTSNSTRSLRIVLLVVIALGGAARAADGITVGGRVLVPGGAPLPEAEVQLVPLLDPLGEARALLAAEEPRAAARTLTDAAGRFRLTAPHAGLWTVRIAAPGFAPLATDLQPLIEPIELVDAELAVDTGMTVRVTAGGAPVAGALVMLRADRSRLSMWGETWRVPLRHGVTDARGSIRLARGEGESTAVSVSAPGWVTGEARGVHGTAATVRLSAGAAETSCSRSGRVSNRSGRPTPPAASRRASQDRRRFRSPSRLSTGGSSRPASRERPRGSRPSRGRWSFPIASRWSAG
jgi:antitoxin (DNA-binding transcriptional repressor) of toxin-antitoxin stability system